MGKMSWMSKNWRNATVQTTVRYPRGPALISSGRSWMRNNSGARNVDFCSNRPHSARKITSKIGGQMAPKMTARSHLLRRPTTTPCRVIGSQRVDGPASRPCQCW